MQFLFKVYRTKSSKKHFILDIGEGSTESEAAEKLNNKIYYFDSAQKKVLGVGRKIELVHLIN